MSLCETASSRSEFEGNRFLRPAACCRINIEILRAPPGRNKWRSTLVKEQRNVITLPDRNACRAATMMTQSPEPRPCKDPHCQGRHAPAERLALAMAICAERGAQLTELRRQILELLWESGRPTGAYELIEALRVRAARLIGPPTIYRALEFLMSHGLVSKIESRNAYVPCAHPERQTNSLFFICSECGSSVELEDPRLDRLIAEKAALIGFRPIRRVVEAEGICSSCLDADAEGG